MTKRERKTYDEMLRGWRYAGGIYCRRCRRRHRVVQWFGGYGHARFTTTCPRINPAIGYVLIPKRGGYAWG